MRVVIARCSVQYSGRLDTTLPVATRAIFVKADGSITVHSDDKGYKPLNWMTKPSYVEMPPVEGETLWVFANKRERLEIILHEILDDSTHPLEVSDPGLVKKGTESHLQRWLAGHPEKFGDGWAFLAREYPTGAGPVDLLMRDDRGFRVAVEVKRVASIGGVDQLSRYVEAITLDNDSTPVRGVLVAFDVRPKARQLAEQRGFTWLEVDKEEFLDSF